MKFLRTKIWRLFKIRVLTIYILITCQKACVSPSELSNLIEKYHEVVFFFLKKEHLFLPVVFNVCVSIIFIHRCLSVLWNHIYMYHRSQHFNFNKTLRNLICLIFKKRSHQEFSGGPVVRTLCFYFWGLRFNPWTQN